MEVKRTVPVKLDVPDERRDDLRTPIEQFNDAANYTIEHGRNDDGYLILNKSKIHDHASGLGDGQLALKSGTLNGNGDYTPDDPSGSADRESTDTPRPQARA
ncbi:hypothetical protein [Halopenitus persicus]|uniref:hypothetical protein n=1 Tax=Halopenitus persicus TaxID=1048396 RepID=UPI0018EE78E4|nr:hypothetical protein [Halopenitus persicus]